LASISANVYLIQKPKKEKPTEAGDFIFKTETGKSEKVFDWSKNKCENEDIPDAPARAFVDYEGNVQLIASHTKTRREIGPNLSELHHSCDVVFSSDNESDPRKYNDREWLTAPYTLDGKNIYSLIHTEYHGWEHRNCNSSNISNCWWNSINLAISTNGGQSYSHAKPPLHNILSSPIDYNPNNTQGPIGFFQPTKIVSKDGYYYALVSQHNPPPDEWGFCLMRTNNLAEPKSWYLWDGSGFNIPAGQTRCKNLPVAGYDLSYNTYLEKYISIACHWEWGCYYSVSDDLIHWQHGGNLFPELPRPHPEICIYSSLIQPGDPTRNFEQSGRSPWLYYTQCGDGKCTPGCSHTGLDRDLKRIRIRFTKPGDENRFELLDLQMNEKKGNKTLDSSFYVNDGNLIGNVFFVQEGEKKFLRFNSDGKVEIHHHDSLNVSGQFTIQAKIRVSSAIPAGSFPTIIRKEADSKRNYGLYLTDQGFLHFSLTNYNGTIGSINSRKVNDGKWHQITVTYDDLSGVVRYYIDNQLDAERYHGVGIENGVNSARVIIGDQNFSGDIDSLTLYNYITIVAPTPTPTPRPTATPTPRPTNTPTPTPNPTATSTPKPTAIPTTKPTPTPTPVTPIPTTTLTPPLLPTATATPIPPTSTLAPTPKIGDVNGDGRVDEIDYAAVIAHFGEEGTPGEVVGDVNNDGRVDEIDYAAVIAHFGS